MAANDRLQWTFKDIGYQQFVQSGRTQFTPGKAISKAQDQNWPVDFRIPTGNLAFDEQSSGPVEMRRVRVLKLERNVICDVVISAPLNCGATTQDNSGKQEKKTGYDYPFGS